MDTNETFILIGCWSHSFCFQTLPSWQSSTSNSCQVTNSCSRYSLCPWPVGKACPLDPIYRKWLVFSFSEQPDYKNIRPCLQCFDTLVHPFTEPYGQQKRALPAPGHGSAEHLELSMSIFRGKNLSRAHIPHAWSLDPFTIPTSLSNAADTIFCCRFQCQHGYIMTIGVAIAATGTCIQ